MKQFLLQVGFLTTAFLSFGCLIHKSYLLSFIWLFIAAVLGGEYRFMTERSKEENK